MFSKNIQAVVALVGCELEIKAVKVDGSQDRKFIVECRDGSQTYTEACVASYEGIKGWLGEMEKRLILWLKHRNRYPSSSEIESL